MVQYLPNKLEALRSNPKQQQQKEALTTKSMVIHIYNSGTWEVKAGESQVQSHPGLYSETLSLKIK
jgi:hypothetical protein